MDALAHFSLDWAQVVSPGDDYAPHTLERLLSRKERISIMSLRLLNLSLS